MTNDKDKSPMDRLLDAYSVMLERANETIDTAEQQARPAIEKAIDEAQKTAHELGELTREEAHKVAQYLKRDLNDAGQYLADTQQEIAEWFRFDVRQIESRLWDAFAQAADKTSLELMKFSDAARRKVSYRTGEISGPGSLMCDACGETQHFDKPTQIPRCPKCGGEVFHRPQ
jgi:vacuolar-type H+-ATPase subunit H/predicted Zn-ribbon and HTH transcriptional regulator